MTFQESSTSRVPCDADPLRYYLISEDSGRSVGDMFDDLRRVNNLAQIAELAASFVDKFGRLVPLVNRPCPMHCSIWDTMHCSTVTLAFESQCPFTEQASWPSLKCSSQIMSCRCPPRSCSLG